MVANIAEELFTLLKTELSPIKCSEPFVGVSSGFPCVTFEEIVNDTVESTIDSGGEQHCEVAYEVVIYTKGSTATSQMREIRSKIDSVFSNKNLTRTTSNNVDNYLDRSVKRHVIRYTAIVDKNNRIFRR